MNASVEAVAWSHQTEPTPKEVKDWSFDDDDEEEQDPNADLARIEAYKKQLRDTPPRLFTAGDDAMITEWNTRTLQPKVRGCVASHAAVAKAKETDDQNHSILYSQTVVRCFA